MTTIVIPAHNEAAVIARCLSAVLGDAGQGEFAVLVASNGTTDGTGERARAAAEALGHSITVLEVPTASKIVALREADTYLERSTDVGRIYLDADVVLSTDGARELANALRNDRPRLALARIEINTAGSPWIVRRYYQAWTAMGYIGRQDAGSGVFAMNRAGIARVQPLPDVINDDGYVARLFSADEKLVCDATFRAFAARSTLALIRRRARIVNGNRQLDAIFPRNASTQSGDLRGAVRNGELPAMSAVVFAAVTAVARALAAWRRRTGGATRWSRDASSRAEADS